MNEPAADLSSPDLRRALAFAGDLAGCRTAGELDRQVRLLPRLVGADTVIIGEVNKPAAGSDEPATLLASDDPPGFFDAEAQEAFARLWQQQPVVVHHFRGFAPQAMKVSDFLTDRQWRRREVFNDCYGKRLGLPWEIAAQIRCTADQIACAALQRAERDFSERDRSLLDAITPQMRAGYARVDAEAERERRLALLERGLGERGAAVLLVDRRGRIQVAAEPAAAILADWFGADQRPGRLPDEVESWRAAQRGKAAPARLERCRPGSRLRLQLVAGAEEDAILLIERRDDTPGAAELAARLPVSRREAEVLALLSQGLLNAAIAHELGISPNTVSRHVERIYAKLGVHNRAAATAAVRDALDDL